MPGDLKKCWDIEACNENQLDLGTVGRNGPKLEGVQWAGITACPNALEFWVRRTCGLLSSGNSAGFVTMENDESVINLGFECIASRVHDSCRKMTKLRLFVAGKVALDISIHRT